MPRIAHRLVGYSTATGTVAVEHEIPVDLMPFMKLLAGLAPDDPAIMCYPLIASREISYYLEGFSG